MTQPYTGSPKIGMVPSLNSLLRQGTRRNFIEGDRHLTPVDRIFISTQYFQSNNGKKGQALQKDINISVLFKSLNIFCIILKNDQTFFLRQWEERKIFKVCLAIFQDYAWKGWTLAELRRIIVFAYVHI